MDNMASACWLNLALRTGFSYTQLRLWSGQAWLYSHIGVEDYQVFKKLTGITDANDLELYLESVKTTGGPDWAAIFNTTETEHIIQKAMIVSKLLPDWLRERKQSI